jgi:hypothetical protein
MTYTVTEALLFLTTHPSEDLGEESLTYPDAPVISVSKDSQSNIASISNDNLEKSVFVDSAATLTIHEDGHITVTYISFNLRPAIVILFHKFEQTGKRTSRALHNRES